jgi:hypothetical protein
MIPVLALLSSIGVAEAAPVQLSHSGRVLDTVGTPISGTHDLRVRLLRADTSAAHTESFDDVAIDGGYYQVVLGSVTALDHSVFASPPLTVEVAVDGQVLGLQPLLAVGNAASATRTDTIDVVSLSGTSCTTAGRIVWNTATSDLQVCVGGTWRAPGVKTIVLQGASRRWSNGTTATSCNEYRYPTGSGLYQGQVGDGDYTIDPDGAGTTYGEIVVSCDMTTSGGGWTRVVAQNYDQATTGWSDNNRTQCGSYGWLHGGYSVFGASDVTSTLTLSGVAHTQLRFATTFVKVDSWDNEVATLFLDGTQRWTQGYFWQNGSSICGNPNAPEWKEEATPIDLTFAHTANTLGVRFTTNLSSPGVDESWGHDDLTVWVK